MTTSKKKRKPLLLAGLLLITTLVALGIGEIVVRLLPAPEPRELLGTLSYQDSSGAPITLIEGIARGSIVAVPTSQTPRPRHTWAPGRSFYLCYSDHETLQKEWMDEQGRVLVHINQHGLRERDEIAHDKPEGQKRIVCIGDSFTFAWGVPIEQGWVRMLENELRTGGDDVRTINCGAAGALVVDEYWWALQHRFSAFDPDAVIVTICLNDLIPCSGLFVQGFAIDTGSVLLDRVLGAMRRSPLDLDPSVDWVELMMGLPAGDPRYSGANPFDAMWAQGGPQRALAAMKAWADNRNIILMVTLWPFLQGMGPGRHYPFEKLHEMVGGECDRLGIPFHDVMPALRGTPSEELWVTPADMHANPRAQRLALPGLAEFVRAHAGW